MADKSLTKIEKGFTEIIKKRYVEQYADDAIKLIAEYKKLEKATQKYADWVKRLEEEDDIPGVIEEYKKERKQLEDIDGYEF